VDHPGVNVIIFGIFKIAILNVTNVCDFESNPAILAQKYHKSGCHEDRKYFCQKVVKINQNIVYNTVP
jgi:hypothetical protein